VPYANELWELVSGGKLKIALAKEDGYEFSTEGARQAHRDISSRSTTGKLLIKTA
jgi:NADPH2:quinone reductase